MQWDAIAWTYVLFYRRIPHKDVITVMVFDQILYHLRMSDSILSPFVYPFSQR